MGVSNVCKSRSVEGKFLSISSEGILQRKNNGKRTGISLIEIK